MSSRSSRIAAFFFALSGWQAESERLFLSASCRRQAQMKAGDDSVKARDESSRVDKLISFAGGTVPQEEDFSVTLTMLSLFVWTLQNKRAQK